MKSKSKETALVEIAQAVGGNASGTSANELGSAAAAQAARSQVIGSLTWDETREVLGAIPFDTLSRYVMTLARWSDVLKAASEMLLGVEKLGISEKTVSATARKIGTLLPMETAILRAAIVSYQLSGRRSNDTQNAELSAKLPFLKKAGALKQGEVSFGSIVLPPSLGEF